MTAIPTTASTTSRSDQPKLFETVSVKSPRLKSEEFSDPSQQHQAGGTPTAPAMEQMKTSHDHRNFREDGHEADDESDGQARRTATQFQSIPRATTMPEPIAKPAAPIG